MIVTANNIAQNDFRQEEGGNNTPFSQSFSQKVENNRQRFISDDEKAYYKQYLPDYLQTHCGVENVWKNFICPIPSHNDVKTESGHYYENSYRFTCFGCGFDGDIYDLIGEIEGISDFPSRLKRVKELFGPYPGEHSYRQADYTVKTPLEETTVIHTDPIKDEKPKKVDKTITTEYHYLKNEGEPAPYMVKRWEYFDAEGNRIGGKKILPYHYNEETKQYEKGLNGPSYIPLLYHLPDIKAGDTNTVIISEGEKCADSVYSVLKAIDNKTCVSTTVAGGANTWKHMGEECFSQFLKGKDVILFPDNDLSGKTAFIKGASSLLKAGVENLFAVWLSQDPQGNPCDKKYDIADWMDDQQKAGKTDEEAGKAFMELIESHKEPVSEKYIFALNNAIEAEKKSSGIRKLKVLSWHDLFNLEIPKRKTLFFPFLGESSLTMVYAQRGVGKSFFAMSVGYAVACGGIMTDKWRANADPVPVLYVDGEMNTADYKERLGSICAGTKKVDTTHKEREYDLFDTYNPSSYCFLNEGETIQPFNLYEEKNQQELTQAIEDHHYKLVILDNISTLCPPRKENDAAAWTPIQNYLINLRQRGVSVLLVHHAGKNNEQRGTSKIEDVLDVSILLSHPSDYEQEQGVRFIADFKKNRELTGEDVKSVEFTMNKDKDGIIRWTGKLINIVDRVREMAELGMTQGAIGNELGKTQSTVSRICRDNGIQTKRKVSTE